MKLNFSGNVFRYIPTEVVSAFFLVLGLLQLVVIIVLAVAVMKDARFRGDAQRGLFLVGPWLWGLIVLLTGGYVGALAYWLIHYSVLRHKDGERLPQA